MKVISQAPTRISIIGGGTDISSYYSKSNGMVISMAINIRQKCIIYTEDDIWEITENIVPYGGRREFIYDIFADFEIKGMHAYKFKSEFDGFIGAGLGSSTACIVSMLGAINKIYNLKLSLYQIAERAFMIESKMTFGGKQ
ncbi:MAG: hypothetical protein AABY22_28580, partial [Nanoarchaeota archaeon]